MATNSLQRRRIICLSVSLAACFTLHASASHAATYYVAPNGNNGASGTQAQPWKTIEYAVSRVNAGDRILVNNGTYLPISSIAFNDHNVSLIANGNAVVIDGAAVPSNKAVIEIYGDDNIVVDGFEIRNGQNRGIALTSNGSTIKNCRIHDNRYEIGLFAWFATNCLIAGNEIYNNGTQGGLGGTTHNVYIAKGCANITIENNYIHDAGEVNLHINGNDPGGASPFASNGINRNIIVRNNIFKNGAASDNDFMNTHDSSLYNNLIINDRWSVSSDDSGPTNSRNNVIANNTFVRSTGAQAITLLGPNAGLYCCANDNYVFNNILITTNASLAIQNDGQNNRTGFNFSATYSQAILTSLFENVANSNYQIKTGTAAHDKGANTFQGKFAPSVDMNGRARPQGVAFDMGAYEIGAAPSGPPAAPAGFLGAPTAASCVGLSWLRNTESDLAGYVLYWGPQSVAQGQVTQYANQRSVGLVTSDETCGLTAGTWYFCIKARNTGGQLSSYAPERTINVSAVDGAAPTILAAYPPDGQVDVPLESRIFFVVSDAQTGVQQSSVNALINGEPAANISFTGTPASYGVVAEPAGLLPPNSTVVVDVSASDRATPPNRSNLVWAFTTTNAAPQPPLLLTVLGPSTGCINVTWNPNPEPDVIGYTVYYGTTSVGGGQAPMYDDSVQVGNLSSRTLCGLASGTYYVALKARNSGGLYSAYSTEISADVTNGSAQGPSSPQQVQLAETAPGCVTVSWQANPEPDIDGYVVHYGPVSVAQGDAIAYGDSIDVGAATSRAICLFPPNTTQYFAVRAYHTAGEYSAYSVEKSINVVGPDTFRPTISLAYPPDGATNVGLNTKVFVVISDAQTGVDTTSIIVRINGLAPRSISHTGTPNNCVIVCDPQGPLPPNRAIQVTVTASDNAVPANTGSGGGTFTTENPAPSVPTGLTATGTTIGCANVAWNASTEPNIVGYTIYYGTLSVEQGQATQYEDSVVASVSTSRTICGLADARYYFALRSRNSSGFVSNFAAEVSAVVTNGTAQGPLPPQQFQASETTPGCVTVSWQANSEPNLVGYRVYWGPLSVAQGDAGQYADSASVGTSLSRQICGFDQSTRYFAVRAYNTLDEYSGYSVERRVDIVGPDRQAPVILVVSPGRNATDVPQNTQIFFTLSDNQMGVDTNTVSVTINGAPPASISFTGNPSNYAAICRTAADFPPNTRINVTVSVADRATPSNTANDTWSFTTGNSNDTTPPTFVSHDPPEGAWVRPDEVITVRIRDNTGIDLSRTIILVNGVAAAPWATIEPNGDMTLRYQRSTGLPAGTVAVQVLAVDLSRNQSVFQFSFTVNAGQPGAGGVPTEIIPDGYWKDEPERPLQVRNIPLGWTIRIFDASGNEVRSFRNTDRDGILWEWDFENNSGHRVARTLYLVRVVDDSGVVKQSGRFVVQIDP